MKYKIDTAAAAVMVGVPPHTIRNWAARGKLQPLKADGTRTIYDAEEVARVAATYGYLPDLRELDDVQCCVPKCDSIAWPDTHVPLCKKHAMAVWLRVNDEWQIRMWNGFDGGHAEPCQSIVYFVRIGDLIKIGTSRSFRSRLDTFRTSSGQVPQVLLVVPGDRTQERQVHSLFKEDRVRGEWFRPTERLLRFIAERAGQDVRGTELHLACRDDELRDMIDLPRG